MSAVARIAPASFALVLCLVLYVDAEDAVENVKTVTYHRSGGTIGKAAKECKWYFAFPDKMRQEYADGNVVVTDYEKGQTIVVDHAKKTVTTAATRKSSDTDRVDLFAEMFRIDKGTRAEEKDATIENRKAKAYKESHETWSQTIWCDADTKLPLRMLHIFTPRTKPPSTFLAKHFKYNVKLDDSLFDVTAIPEDYTVVEHSPAPAKSETEWKVY